MFCPKCGQSTNNKLNDNEKIKIKIMKITKFKEELESASVGEEVEFALDNVKKSEIEREQIVLTPSNTQAAKEFDANVYFYTKDEGGRTTPLFDGYRPQVKFYNTLIHATVNLPFNTDMVVPGDEVNLHVTLSKSTFMQVGSEFKIMETEKVVATGKVTKVYGD